MKRSFIIAVLATGLSGCAIGNRLDSNRDRTLGQDLLELETARQEGFISDEQYHEQRNEILEMSNVHLRMESWDDQF